MNILNRLFEERFHSPVTHVHPLQGQLGGSGRQIIRLSNEANTAIGIVYGVREENVAFLEFSKHFRRHGLPVPDIYGEDLDHGVYLEEDLGNTTLYEFLSKNRDAGTIAPPVVEAYRKVAAILPRFQVEAGRDVNYEVCYPIGSFDRQSVAWDLNYFKYYFLRLAGVPFSEQALEDDFGRLTDFLMTAERDYFLYRDFQSRNIIAPATLTILTATFTEGAARARALGVWSAVSAAGTSAGALFGGILTDFLSWRWILFVNVPVGAMALVAARRDLPESKAEMVHRHLDLAGAVTVTAGLVSLVFALVRTETYSWGSAQVLVPLALAVVLVAVFLFLQARVSKAPLVPLHIFRSRSVSGGNVGDADDVRRALRILVLRDALHAARAGLQSAPGRGGLPAPDPADRRRRASRRRAWCPDSAHARSSSSARWWPAVGWRGCPRSRPAARS